MVDPGFLARLPIGQEMEQGPHGQHDIGALQEEEGIFLDWQIADAGAEFFPRKSPDAPLRGEIVPRRGKDHYGKKNQRERLDFPGQPRHRAGQRCEHDEERQIENEVKPEVGHFAGIRYRRDGNEKRDLAWNGR